MSNRCFILANPPVSSVEFGEGENATFKLVTKPMPIPQDGQALVRNIYFSNDPTQRAWIQKGIRPDRMYVEPVKQGQIMRSVGLAQVVELKNPNLVPGDIVNATVQWAEYLLVNDASIFSKITDKRLPLPLYLDVLGTTGLTAYFGLLNVADLKQSDTLVVSAALGATGSMCVQIAKHIIGCKVVGISGGQEKCAFVKLLGADECVDYKSPTFAKDMKKALDGKFCDVFFDGVGGKILDVMLTLVKPFGQVIACGAIAGYNNPKNGLLGNWGQIITNRLNVKGFIVLDFQKEYPKAMAELGKWIREGKIKYDPSTYTLMDLSKKNDGFTLIPETWGLLFSDTKAPGKLLTKLAEPKL